MILSLQLFVAIDDQSGGLPVQKTYERGSQVCAGQVGEPAGSNTGQPR